LIAEKCNFAGGVIAADPFNYACPVIFTRTSSSFVAIAIYASIGLAPAQSTPIEKSAMEFCADYSGVGDLVQATISREGYHVVITRHSGQTVELGERHPTSATRVVAKCHLAISVDSEKAAVAFSTASGIFVRLIDLPRGEFAQSVDVPHVFPIQFEIYGVGFIGHTNQLAISQAHYQPTGEPEIITQRINGSVILDYEKHRATGYPYSEIYASSYDYGRDRVWFLCPPVSARIDRQPRCTLTSASLTSNDAPSLEVPPPPDDRVIGSGQPNLGSPSDDSIAMLAWHRLWVYSFASKAFRQMNIPETPRHIRWFEFPRAPKFTADGRYAALPVDMSHGFLFEEGGVSHGTKILLVDMSALSIIKTMQPEHEQSLVDFAVRNEGDSLTLATNWGKDWQVSRTPIVAPLK
jgi:hypothetical protein